MKISNKSTFQPDGRNIGGRTQVINQHFNHIVSLQSIKPILNIQQILASPKITKKSNLNQPLYKKINEFHEIYETFRRVACVKKGLTDSLTPPETFNLIRSYKKPFQKNKFQIQKEIQHYKNCQILDSKLKQIKNSYSLLDSLGETYTFQVKKRPESGKFRSTLSNNFLKQHHKTKKKKCNFNKEDIKWKNIFYDVPINQELNEETLAETKAQLVDVLIKYRLYKQEEFQNIQEIFTFKNPHIDKEIIQSVFKEIIEAFNE